MFSDIVVFFYVSGFEFFLDFDVSECSEVFFVEIVLNKDINIDFGMFLIGENVG